MQALKFLGVGSVGFVTDAMVFVLMQALNADIVTSRIFAFWAAVVVTYLGNSRFTFETGKNKQAFLTYFIAMHATGFTNLSVFMLLTFILPMQPWFAFAAGVAVGTLLNFVVSKKVLKTT